MSRVTASSLLRPLSTQEKLRNSANGIEAYGTQGQAGLSPVELRDVADQIDRMETCLKTLQHAAQREGYDVLIDIDGMTLSLARRDDTPREAREDR